MPPLVFPTSYRPESIAIFTLHSQSSPCHCWSQQTTWQHAYNAPPTQRAQAFWCEIKLVCQGMYVSVWVE